MPPSPATALFFRGEMLGALASPIPDGRRMTSARPEDVDMLKPNDRCWCGSGLKYKRCHQAEDRAKASLAFSAAPAVVRHTPQGRPWIVPGHVSPMREVPPEIPRPDYALTGRPRRKILGREGCAPMTPEQLERMRRACKAAAQVLQATGMAVRPGITTDELDAIAHRETIARGAYPSCLNYHGYPKSICTSVNEVICHGIPDDRPLEDGDIVNVDVTVYLDGMHGDCSATYEVGKVSDAARKLVDVTRSCLDHGIQAVKPGRPISDIGKAIEALATAKGYGVVRAYCGHGIGESFHSGIYVPHYHDRAAKDIMVPGMTFTIEPMITIGSYDCGERWADGWTEVTADRDLTAQFEHTLVVTEEGAEILTLP